MAQTQLPDEVVITTHPTTGQRLLAVLPVIPDDAPYAVHEGIARRRVTVLTGRCPCGATFTPPADPHRGAVTQVDIEHERGCSAVTKTLTKAIRRWMR